MFKSVRSRGKRKKVESKVTHYKRDVIFSYLKSSSHLVGEISVPRTAKCTLLDQAGLVGKIELNASMTEKDVSREICDVFATPMGLLEREKDKQSTLTPFSFSSLQIMGSGAVTVSISRKGRL